MSIFIQVGFQLNGDHLKVINFCEVSLRLAPLVLGSVFVPTFFSSMEALFLKKWKERNEINPFCFICSRVSGFLGSIDTLLWLSCPTLVRAINLIDTRSNIC